VAPVACTATSLKQNASFPSPESVVASACRHASNNAGCRLNPLTGTSSGSATSAYVAVPSRQTRRRHWNVGP
jgi:hypothetical protein